MIHCSVQPAHEIGQWCMCHPAYERITCAYESRGYVTTHALMAYYPGTKEGRWVIVQELQRRDDLTCYWLCYLAGSRGGVYEKTESDHCAVSPRRNDLTLHEVPIDGLWFWESLRDAGYDDATISLMREDRYANYLF